MGVWCSAMIRERAVESSGPRKRFISRHCRVAATETSRAIYRPETIKVEPPRIAREKSWSELLAIAARLRFEWHDIRARLDATGRYDVELAREFP